MPDSNRLNELGGFVYDIRYRDMMQLAAEMWRFRPQVKDTDPAGSADGIVSAAQLAPMIHAWAESRRPLPPQEPEEPHNEPVEEPEDIHRGVRVEGGSHGAGGCGGPGDGDLQTVPSPSIAPLGSRATVRISVNDAPQDWIFGQSSRRDAGNR